jgi:hypothetical protein
VSIALLLLVVPGDAPAQKVPVGPPEFVVNEATAGDQGRWHGPDVARGPAGGFVVVWDGSGPYTGGRRFDSAGAPLGPDFAIADYEYFNVSKPAMDSDASGNFVVVWDPFSYYMEARRFDSSGAPLGEPFQANTETSAGPRNPKVAVQPDGRFMIVWGQFDTSYHGISGRLFDSNGTPATPEFHVDTEVGDSDGYIGYEDDDGIEIAAGAAGNFLVVWENDHEDFPNTRILGRLFDSAGTAAGPVFQVDSGASPFAYITYAGVAGDGQGNFIVAWREYGVKARRFDSGGAALGPPFQVSAATTDYASYVKVDADAVGNFVVVWQQYEDYQPYFPRHSVHVRQFDSAANAIPGEFVLGTSLHGPYNYVYDAYVPDVAFTGGGNFVVAWRSYSDGDEGGIRAQRFGSATGPCSPSPMTTCREPTVPRSGVFRFLESANPARSVLVWRWVRGEATPVGALGDPRTDTSYALCVYDASANPQPLMVAEAPFGGTCGDLPCWNPAARGTAFGYRDDPASGGGSTNAAGIRRIRLQSGAAGRASITLQARGANLTLPDGPLTLPVTVQMQASSGFCWSATYDAFVTANVDGKFRGQPGS